jgi:hypothetical protein
VFERGSGGGAGVDEDENGVLYSSTSGEE